MPETTHFRGAAYELSALYTQFVFSERANTEDGLRLLGEFVQGAQSEGLLPQEIWIEEEGNQFALTTAAVGEIITTLGSPTADSHNICVDFANQYQTIKSFLFAPEVTNLFIKQIMGIETDFRAGVSAHRFFTYCISNLWDGVYLPLTAIPPLELEVEVSV